jgi:formyltetrahydrofolate synthetase
MCIPGLPEHPAAEKIRVDSSGKITGLFQAISCPGARAI